MLLCLHIDRRLIIKNTRTIDDHPKPWRCGPKGASAHAGRKDRRSIMPKNRKAILAKHVTGPGPGAAASSRDIAWQVSYRWVSHSYLPFCILAYRYNLFMNPVVLQ